MNITNYPRRLKRILVGSVTLIALFGLGTAAATSPPANTAAPSQKTGQLRAKSLLEHTDDLWRGTTSHAALTMHVKTKHYERSLSMEAWSKGKERSLVRISAPRREKGTATLKAGDRMYTYLPRTDRVIRLTSGMMGGNWMGSHFSNDDLVKESRMSEDYTFNITFEGVRAGQKIIEITLVPKPDAAVVWGKVIFAVNAATKLPISQRYFDEKGRLARTMTYSDTKLLGGRQVPSVMRIVPANKPSEFTEVRYTKLDVSLKLDDGFFAIQRLKRK